MEKEERERLANEECRKVLLECKKMNDEITEKYKNEPGMDGHSDEYRQVKEYFFRKQREINEKYGLI